MLTAKDGFLVALSAIAEAVTEDANDVLRVHNEMCESKQYRDDDAARLGMAAASGVRMAAVQTRSYIMILAEKADEILSAGDADDSAFPGLYL